MEETMPLGEGRIMGGPKAQLLDSITNNMHLRDCKCAGYNCDLCDGVCLFGWKLHF